MRSQLRLYLARIVVAHSGNHKDSTTSLRAASSRPPLSTSRRNFSRVTGKTKCVKWLCSPIVIFEEYVRCHFGGIPLSRLYHQAQLHQNIASVLGRGLVHRSLLIQRMLLEVDPGGEAMAMVFRWPWIGPLSTFARRTGRHNCRQLRKHNEHKQRHRRPAQITIEMFT